jgi:hypothetical protein
VQGRWRCTAAAPQLLPALAGMKEPLFPNRVQISYCPCRIGPGVSYLFQQGQSERPGSSHSAADSLPMLTFRCPCPTRASRPAGAVCIAAGALRHGQTDRGALRRRRVASGRRRKTDRGGGRDLRRGARRPDGADRQTEAARVAGLRSRGAAARFAGLRI